MESRGKRVVGVLFLQTILLCVYVEEFAEGDMTLNVSLTYWSQLRNAWNWRHFKNMKEAMVKMPYWILSVDLCLKQQNVDWRILLVLAWIYDKSSERLCPGLDIDQREDQGQLHRLYLSCFVEYYLSPARQSDNG